MRNKIIILATIAICLLATVACADSIKDRMADRAPTITALKDQGLVGENNQGFLEIRSPQAQSNLVADENRDRAAVYQAIAKKIGTTPDLVGQRRAGKLAEMARSGNWLQASDGSWYQK